MRGKKGLRETVVVEKVEGLMHLFRACTLGMKKKKGMEGGLLPSHVKWDVARKRTRLGWALGKGRR